MEEERLYEIYETFVDLLIEGGWKGQPYGWRESQRHEATEGGWAYFQLDNGFNMKLTYVGNGQEVAMLQYWFTEVGEMISVDSLEQLLELLK